MTQFYFGRGYLLRSFYCFGGWIGGNANEFSLDIWGFYEPKTLPGGLGGVSCMGSVLAELVRILLNRTWLRGRRRDRSRRRRGGGGDPAAVGERSGHGPPQAGPVVLDDDNLAVEDPGQH